MQVIKNKSATGIGPAERFVGTALVDRVTAGTEGVDVTVASVTFTPCSRTNWHMHPKGQILVVTDGVGWVGTRDGQKHEIRAGDVVITNPDEEHWHGATESNRMTHFAITPLDENGEAAVWGAPVAEEQYLA
jgi:quercetin dioxygenase-like cupin family protein